MLRQLGDVGGDAPGLVAGEEVRRRAASGLLLMDERERLPEPRLGRHGAVYEIGPQLRPPADLDHPDLEQRSPIKRGNCVVSKYTPLFVRG
jgi:hypothetical protein